MDVFKKRSSSRESYYSAELQVAIGNSGDSSKLIEQTKEQILYRLRGSYMDLSLEKTDNNVYTLKANKIIDTTVFKNAITASGEIEFSELFTINEISESLTAIDSTLRSRDAEFLTTQKKIQEAKKNLDTTTGKLSDILEHGELEKSQDPGLAKFISFASSYQNSDGSLRYTAELGYVKTKDTSYLNQIFADAEISRHFPENLKIIYGAMDVDLYSNDSMLRIFAKKNLDRAFFPFPTGDQINNASAEFDPSNSNPIILFAFNAQGSQDWYQMTLRNVKKPIAIITNNIVLTAAFVEEAIEGGESRITGAFSLEEATLLSKMILSGELPLTTRITEASFKHHASKKMGLTVIILILFVLSTAASYGISLSNKTGLKTLILTVKFSRRRFPLSS